MTTKFEFASIVTTKSFYSIGLRNYDEFMPDLQSFQPIYKLNSSHLLNLYTKCLDSSLFQHLLPLLPLIITFALTSKIYAPSENHF